MVYETLLIVGALGLLAQSLLRFGHGHAGNAHHAGHATVAGHHGHAGDAAHGPTQTGERSGGAAALWTLFSPLTIFSLCLGAGATGLLVHAFLSRPLTALAAAAGGLAFYGVLVRPLWNLIFRFASEPSRALEGTVAQVAEAVSHFDSAGRGVVRVTLDGQLVRLLARLEADDQKDAAVIAPGDKLVVTGVDGRANTCRVTRL